MCDIHWFFGVVNYYRDVCHNHAHAIAPLAKLCFNKVRLKWTDVEQYEFVEINKIVSRDVLLSYPIFSKDFIIHKNDRKTKFGGVIIQNWNPVDFYSHKLACAQINYTNTENNSSV